jgi:hypothetical protein
MTNFANDYQKLFINPLATAEKKTSTNIAKNLPVLQAAMAAIKSADVAALRPDGSADTKAFKAKLGEWVFLADNQNRTHLYAIRQLIKNDITIDMIETKLRDKPVKSIAGVWSTHFKPKAGSGRNSAANGGNAGLAGISGKAIETINSNIETHLMTAAAKAMAANYGNLNAADIAEHIKAIAIAMLKDNGISQTQYKAFQQANKKAA